ncbi:MAG: ABC transporter permease subunit [Bdellovibrionales bacterium]|nr:ABC transporter permease subunit [Bdellovibrionales bacterium]
MTSILLIARRDLRNYFTSPIAYIVIAVFLLLMGWMFFNLLSFFQQQTNQFAALSFGTKPTLSDSVVRPLYGNMNVILLFVAPFITMRLLAEERKDHTVELLLTAPVTTFQIIAGKFLSALMLILVMLGLSLVYPLILLVAGNPDPGVLAGCYAGLFFVAATYVAVGLFWSSRTENQIVAAVLTFGTLLFFWLISWAAHQAGPIWKETLEHLSIIGHYANFSQGVLDTSDVIYYLSFIGFGLFLTQVSLDAENWS